VSKCDGVLWTEKHNEWASLAALYWMENQTVRCEHVSQRVQLFVVVSWGLLVEASNASRNANG